MRPRRLNRLNGCAGYWADRASTSSARIASAEKKTRKLEFLIGDALKMGG